LPLPDADIDYAAYDYFAAPLIMMPLFAISFRHCRRRRFFADYADYYAAAPRLSIFLRLFAFFGYAFAAFRFRALFLSIFSADAVSRCLIC